MSRPVLPLRAQVQAKQDRARRTVAGWSESAINMTGHAASWWSPKGDRLLVFEFDESLVGVKRRAQIHADHTAIVDQRYPAAVEADAKVTAWIYPVRKGANNKRVAIALSVEDGYLPCAGSFADQRA